jgi:hypothetical protein
MPCDMLSVQVVGLEDEALLRLLTPEQTLAAVVAALEDLNLKTDPGWQTARDGYVRAYADERYQTYTITVQAGRITVDGERRDRAKAIADGVGAAVRQLAIAVLGQTVAATLADLSGGVAPEVETLQAAQDGRVFPIQRLTVSW